MRFRLLQTVFTISTEISVCLSQYYNCIGSHYGCYVYENNLIWLLNYVSLSTVVALAAVAVSDANASSVNRKLRMGYSPEAKLVLPHTSKPYIINPKF